MTIDNEATRLAIMGRIPTSAWGNPDRALCEPKSGEILKSTYVTPTQGVLVFEQKYGERPGIRTVVFVAPTPEVLTLDDGTITSRENDFRLMTNAFADMPTPVKNLARIELLRRVNVLEAIEAPSTDSGEMLPSDATSPAMSYTFHVRSYGDNHVICSTSSLDDAKRIVKALGNCGVFQFRDSSSYDDTTIWSIGRVMQDA